MTFARGVLTGIAAALLVVAAAGGDLVAARSAAAATAKKQATVAAGDGRQGAQGRPAQHDHAHGRGGRRGWA